MKADFDSEATVLSIDLTGAPCASHAEEISDRCNVAMDCSDRPIGVEVLNLDKPYEDLLRTAGHPAGPRARDRLSLDPCHLAAAARPSSTICCRMQAQAGRAPLACDGGVRQP